MTFDYDLNNNVTFRRGEYGCIGLGVGIPNEQTGKDDALKSDDTEFYIIVKKNITDADEDAVINKKLPLSQHYTSWLDIPFFPHETNRFTATEEGNVYLWSLIYHRPSDGRTNIVIPKQHTGDAFPTITVYPSLEDVES